MKYLMLIFIFAYTGSAYSGGSDTKPSFLMHAISGHELSLMINNEIITGSFATIDGGSDTITKPSFRSMDGGVQTMPVIINSMKYAGESDASIFLNLNDSSLTVEIMDSEIYKSQDLIDVINEAARSQSWIITK